MAGSLKYFTYTADDGTKFAVFADESNIEAVNNGNVEAITPAAKYKLPGNLKPRCAAYENTDGTIRRKVIVLNEDALAALAPGQSFSDQSSGVSVFLRRIDGEAIQLPNLADTGLNDQDDP
jgi:hypothetical protein